MSEFVSEKQISSRIAAAQIVWVKPDEKSENVFKQKCHHS